MKNFLLILFIKLSLFADTNSLENSIDELINKLDEHTEIQSTFLFFSLGAGVGFIIMFFCVYLTVRIAGGKK